MKRKKEIWARKKKEERGIEVDGKEGLWISRMRRKGGLDYRREMKY